MSDMTMEDMMLEPEAEPEFPEQVEEVEEPEPAFDPDEFAGQLWRLVRDYEQDDEDAHRTYFNTAIRSEFYWNHQQHLYQDATGANSFQWKPAEDESTLYTANIYRPNGESIIAAMSASLPQVTFYPDDADNPDDVTTATAYQKIAQLIQKHNEAQLLVIKMLFILYNQSFVAVYNYNKKSNKFGTYQNPVYEDSEQIVETPVCPMCGAKVEDTSPPIVCNTCGSPVEAPELVPETQTVTQIVGLTDEPKSREILEAYGPLHVKIAPNVQRLEDTPYLILDVEHHHSKGKAEFPEFKEKLGDTGNQSETDYERDYRSQLYKGEYDHLHTWKYVWLRPSAYEVLASDDKLYQHLVQTYPGGVKAIFINGTLVSIENEKLDDHWTLSQSPLSTFINAESLGEGGISIQDAANELVNLSMDTIKHGIPQTFADGQIVDFEKYAVSQIKPGNIYPTKALPSGQPIANFIHTTRTATLSQEVDNVWDKLQQLGQLTTGAFPSIYGGVVQGSRTASEYAQSRAQALQRLNNTWTMLKSLWANVMSKACVSYAKNLAYDEKDVQKQGNGFINVWIRKAELNGKIGKVEPEVDEQLPTSWAQQREVLMRLIEMNSDLINPVLADAENAYVIKNALGFREIKIPGYDDRQKQLEEIQQLIQAAPISELDPSVPIDKMLDNHEIEAEVCRSFLIGEVGRDLRNTNPMAFQNVYLHFAQHAFEAAQRAAMQQAQEEVNQEKQQQQKPKQPGGNNG